MQQQSQLERINDALDKIADTQTAQGNRLNHIGGNK